MIMNTLRSLFVACEEEEIDYDKKTFTATLKLIKTKPVSYVMNLHSYRGSYVIN